MIAFEVKDMSCGHCISNLTKALAAADPRAKVHFDLATHRVDIEPDAAGATALGDAIRDAGYSPRTVEGAPVQAASSAAPARRGCCCSQAVERGQL